MVGSQVGVVFDFVASTILQVWQIYLSVYSLDDWKLIMPLLLTNVVATTLIGIRVWLYRRDVMAWIGSCTVELRVGAVLMLLPESGIMYCVLWVFYIVTPTLLGDNDYGIYITLFFLLADIYPTFIVVVVTLQQQATSKSLGAQSNFLESIRFISHRSEQQREEDSRSEDCVQGSAASNDVLEEIELVSRSRPAGPGGAGEWVVG
ncbi:hypothetical protein BD626DRAFT_567719 [Schizophyllum amplum]|uniref:Uncharacterized protein n=1 Tax=Schizophyllum amplum TaxID=97359 RepID=A0A550CJC6_9AGAR|nr:hypothetical protein BD626DRAFT_567719 [Auriculariopsis ampla]